MILCKQMGNFRHALQQIVLLHHVAFAALHLLATGLTGCSERTLLIEKAVLTHMFHQATTCGAKRSPIWLHCLNIDCCVKNWYTSLHLWIKFWAWHVPGWIQSKTLMRFDRPTNKWLFQPQVSFSHDFGCSLVAMDTDMSWYVLFHLSSPLVQSEKDSRTAGHPREY